jgi:GT2 family glycosyltransferase
MNDSKVAVVILNFNGRHFLEKFLPSIVQHSAPHQVYVADNGSTDDSIAWTKENFNNVIVVANGSNYGYSQGYNEALKKITATYFVLLNSDVEVTPGWIEPVKALMDANGDIAACQPKVLDYNSRDKFEYAGAAGGFIDRLGYPFCRGRIFNSLETDHGQYAGASEVFWATGACMFVRSAAFYKAGALDNDYFAHMEEIDLCWRMKNLGYKIYYHGDSVVYHVGGGTLNKYSSRKTFLNFRNNLTTLTKNHPARWLFMKIMARLVLDGVAGIKFLLEGQPDHCLAVIRAHWSYYSWVPRILKQRRSLSKTPGFRFTVTGVYKGNVVSEYFLHKKKKFPELHRGFFSE